MRNLKRALSLALAAIMVMSLMVVGAGAVNLDDFSDKDQIVNKEAVTVLTTLNVINGKDDGSYDPTGIVTRAEMAKIICVILNGGSDPALGTSTTHTYTDTVNHWAEAYIEYCTQLGIVAGKGNGTFDPNGTVTATEAAKMLLVALGYNAGFENMVGANWAVSTNVLANQNKLYAGLDIDVDAGLTRDNAAQMAYNALNCEMVAYTYALVTGSDGSLTSIPRVEKKDDTLLSDKFGGVRVEGVVVRNEQTAASFDGKTRIDITNEDELTKVGHNFGDVATFETVTDASLLGTSVFFYVVPSVASPTNSEKATVLGSVMDSGKNVVVTTTKTFGSDKVAGYMKDNDITVNSDTVLYVNGAVSSTAISALVNQTGNEVKFIDSDNDGITESVVKTNYGFGKVIRYNDKEDGGLTIDTYTDSKDLKIDKIVGFADVALNDYVVYNTMGGKLYVVKAETVEGTLETFKKNSDRLKANLTVDGTTYTFSESGNYDGRDGELKTPDTYLDSNYMGKAVTLYLDKFGYVAAASDVKGFTDYAYVANATTINDATGLASDVRVYVTLPDGTSASYLVKNYKDGTWEGKPTGVTGETTPGAHPITKGNVYGYYLTSDGKIELTNVTNNAVVNGSSNDIEFNKGSSTIKTTSAMKSKMTDNNTVFFYVMMEVDAAGKPTSTIKSIESYVGKDNAPSIKVTSGTSNTSVYTVPSRKDESIAGAVVFQVGEVASANVLYLYQYVKSTDENTIYNAVIDGKLVENITVDSKDDTLAGAPYVYTMTSKGYYSLTNVTSTSTVSGHVALSEGKSVVVGGQEVKITADTTLAEIDGSDTNIISNVTEKDWVTVVYNPNNDEALGIYLEEPYSNDNANILKVDGTTVKKSTGDYDYEVAAGTTATTVKSNIKTSYGTSVYVVNTRPATDKAALAVKADDVLYTNGNAYIVVKAPDGVSYRIYVLKVGSASSPDKGGSDTTTPSTSGVTTLSGSATAATVNAEFDKGNDVEITTSNYAPADQIVIPKGRTLTINGNYAPTAVEDNAGTLVVNGTYTAVASSTLTGNVTAQDITVTTKLTVDSGATVTVTKATYTNGAAIEVANGGTLVVNAFTPGANVTNNGTLTVKNDYTPGSYTLTGTGTTTIGSNLVLGSTAFSANGTVNVLGNVTASANTTVLTVPASSELTVNGTVAGAVTLSAATSKATLKADVAGKVTVTDGELNASTANLKDAFELTAGKATVKSVVGTMTITAGELTYVDDYALTAALSLGNANVTFEGKVTGASTTNKLTIGNGKTLVLKGGIDDASKGIIIGSGTSSKVTFTVAPDKATLADFTIGGSTPVNSVSEMAGVTFTWDNADWDYTAA
ncbi:S-layer homology domain-containing protein [Intestinimonas sp. HCP28S3_D6]|uniref:S-layer homology domain-containing protein n=1 Tax=Intestinimonas sp. HCP28S3_D6 TaxID=3438942 RepID=UPI003F890173